MVVHLTEDYHICLPGNLCWGMYFFLPNGGMCEVNIIKVRGQNACTMMYTDRAPTATYFSLEDGNLHLLIGKCKRYGMSEGVCELRYNHRN